MNTHLFRYCALTPEDKIAIVKRKMALAEQALLETAIDKNIAGKTPEEAWQALNIILDLFERERDGNLVKGVL